MYNFLFLLTWALNIYIYILFNRKLIFDTPEEDPNYNPLPEERPGGFAWGEGQRLGGWDPANIFDERLGKQTTLENGSVLLHKGSFENAEYAKHFFKNEKQIWSKDILQKKTDFKPSWRLLHWFV